ncbi:putative glycolipid-binding domain-containing protein [Burkholderia multivorans]|uniref:putative glycolipid-binding domain-containing protein n=1 Tax=Burkholderia multivorans TaxID=87883 RepID=UPI001C239D84|nr:putative glycolipid-binding domain-containing protein [Burkholderia multivorans]MBU9661417.1 putative glycolipid-binding domain-containing protein [Burkholderia multivorans]
MMQRHEAPHTHCVAWQIAQTWHAAEWCRLVDGRDGIELSGSVAGAIDGTPFRVDYAIACDADWLTRSARVTRWIGAAARQIDLRCDGGRWTIDGVDASALDGATDVDLGFSPSTNTLPIRRLALKVGDAAAIRTAWLRFPAFDIVRGEQRYRRIAPNAYRYESGTYAADLTVDAAGLVIDYDEWRRIGAIRAP